MGSYEISHVRAFLAVNELRSATAAADALDISQPSVSYGLGKLRTFCADPLFYRSGPHLVPTPLARSLYPKLRHAIDTLDAAMLGAGDFDPSTADNNFIIMMTEIGIAGLLPQLARAVSEAAPNVTLEVESFDPVTMADALRTGRISACVCVPRVPGRDLLRRTIFKNRYAGICAPTHPRIGDRPTLEEYVHETHVSMTPQAGYDGVDQYLIDQEIHRHIALRLPTFNGVAAVVGTTEYISFAPRLAAERMARYGLVRTFELPFDPPPTTVNLYTLDADELSPSARWFGSLVYTTLRDLGS